MKSLLPVLLFFLALAGGTIFLFSGDGDQRPDQGLLPVREKGDAPVPDQETSNSRDWVRTGEGTEEPLKTAVVQLKVQVSSSRTGLVGKAEVVVELSPSKTEIKALTGSDGQALLALPPGAKGLLKVDHPDFLPWRSPLTEKGKFLEVQLKPAAVLVGRVLGWDGQPAASALIEVLFPGRKKTDKTAFQQRVDATGDYQIGRIPPGSNLLVNCRLFTASGTRERQKQATLGAGTQTRVDFDFTPSGPVVEGFLFASFNQPATGWRLIAQEVKGDLQASVLVGKGGFFRLQVPHQAKFTFYACQNTPAWLRLGMRMVPDAGIADLRFYLGGLEIAGQLAAPEGENLPPDAVVTAYQEKQGRLEVAAFKRFDAKKNTFCLSGLVPGLYRLVVKAPGYPEKMIWLGKLAATRNEVGTILLSRHGAGELLVYSQGKNCEPPQTFSIWRQEGDNLIPLTAQPGEAKGLNFPGIPAGKWKLRVEAPGFVPALVPVEIKAGVRSQLTLVFVRGYTFTVKVILPPGKELKALVGRLRQDGPVMEAQQTAGGLWAFPALPPGEHQLTLGASGFNPTKVAITVPAGQRPAVQVRMQPR